jgi:hypothetical protein
LEDLSLIHDTETERRIIEQCSLAGASDGATNTTDFLADGVSLVGQQAMMSLLREAALRKTAKIFYDRA